MALNNVILLSQMAGYVIAFILSLCIAIPMTLHQDEFRYSFFYVVLINLFITLIFISNDSLPWLMVWVPKV